MVIWLGLAVKMVKSFGVGSWAVVGQGRKRLKSCSAWCCRSFVVIGSCFEGCGESCFSSGSGVVAGVLAGFDVSTSQHGLSQDWLCLCGVLDGKLIGADGSCGAWLVPWAVG